MSFSESLESLRKIDLADLDVNNAGSWPGPVKAIACVLLMVVVLVAGYKLHLEDLEIQLDQQKVEEETLKEQFSTKAFQAANLDAYKEQMKEMEVQQQFYIELPIQIVVEGAYHDLATFVSGVSSLPRIVTLHDFDLAPVNPSEPSKLRMSVLAKTYRYNDQGLKK